MKNLGFLVMTQIKQRLRLSLIGFTILKTSWHSDFLVQNANPINGFNMTEMQIEHGKKCSFNPEDMQQENAQCIDKKEFSR